MKPVAFLSLALALAALSSPAVAAGFSRSDNFVVMAAEKSLADEALAQAEKYRREIARQWLGAELPPSVGQTVLHVEITDEGDSAHTWVIDDPRRQYHRVWVNGSRRQVLGSTLRHEISHVVMATRFPQGLPLWINEGIASLNDDAERVATRRRIIGWYAQTDNWPPLARILNAEAMRAHDRETYSVAASLTEYLLSLDDRATLVAFAATAAQRNWDEAL
ncbi:MAG: hypothetical protein ACOC46_01970, partial [Pirellulales bacterium]